MADNELNNDEYKFSDLDMSSVPQEDLMDNPGDASSSFSSSAPDPFAFARENRARSVLIILSAILAVVFLYKIGYWLFAEDKKIIHKTSVSTAPIVKPNIVQSTVPALVKTEQPVPVTPTLDMNQKLSEQVNALQMKQQTMQSEVAAMDTRINNLSNSMHEMLSKLDSLNQGLLQLTDKIADQAILLDKLTVRRTPIVRPHIRRHSAPMSPRTVYYIQAIIPGRAWLLSSNGTTLTVREGTPLSGYGVVKLIDPIQGRVLTSSGQILRFSQDDS